MINNSAEFTSQDLIVLFGSKNIISINGFFTTTGVCIDSREVKENNLFVAIKGENFDGHNFIKEVINKSAGAVVISEEYYNSHKNELESVNCIIVSDTLDALHKLAKYHRKRFNYPVIAIGGSNGKTTTKEMLAEILACSGKVLKTYKNYNNQIGVPMMLLAMDNSYHYAVLEIGTNMPGEISVLSHIVAPTHGLITNIGKEHLELLLDLDGVELEETFLYGYLRNRGYSLVNNDDPRLKRYKPILEKTLTYGTTADAMVNAEISFNSELQPKLAIKQGEEIKFEVQLQTYGYGSALNALAASACALLLDIGTENIIKGLTDYVPERSEIGYGRMQVEKLGDKTIINDCYNSNPSSCELALKTLAVIKSNEYKIAVLGDMLELGDASNDEHNEILELACTQADKVFLFGNEFKEAIDEGDYANAKHYETHDLLIDELNKAIKPNSTILIKGSRGMKMENIVNSLIRKSK